VVVAVASGEQRQWQWQWQQEDASVKKGTPVEFLCSFNMYVLVGFCSRHFIGTPPQTMLSAGCPSPNGPLGNESMPRYFRGTFHWHTVLLICWQFVLLFVLRCLAFFCQAEH
jgi:hypothetical protein